jgi:hypothetical protein
MAGRATLAVRTMACRRDIVLETPLLCMDASHSRFTAVFHRNVGVPPARLRTGPTAPT